MENFVFKHQLNSRGLYTNIHFNIKINTTKPSGLTIEYNADKHWEIPCIAGIKIFYDYYRLQKNDALTITVLSIDWLPVDTNNLIIMYSTVKGLSEILNVNLANLNFDLEDETFVFPEPRNTA